jgi:hypothetical protein
MACIALALGGAQLLAPARAETVIDAWSTAKLQAPPALKPHLANAARISAQVTLTRLDMVKF